MLNRSQIEALEDAYQGRVLVLAASNIEIDLLPTLYETLIEIGHTQRLGVVLYGRGGIVNAARRIALLLREFTDQLDFIVPYFCESSATILALAGNSIIAGSLAIFSPIDPHLQGLEASDGDSPATLSCQDIRLFSEMMQNWFELEESEAHSQSRSLLCNSIFPTTLTSFYRSTLELQEIGEQLLSFQLPDYSKEQRAKIIEKLLYGYHSHSYAITRDELHQLGLNIQHQSGVEALAWKISCDIRANLGAGVSLSLEDGWKDMIIATTDKIHVRKRKLDETGIRWQTIEFKNER